MNPKNPKTLNPRPLNPSTLFARPSRAAPALAEPGCRSLEQGLVAPALGFGGGGLKLC